MALAATALAATAPEGIARLEAGDLDGALAILEPLAKARHPDALACQGMGRLSLERGDAEAAIAWLEKAVRLEPGNADHHGLLAHALDVRIEQAGGAAGLGQLARAKHLRAELLRTLELDPSHEQALAGLVEFYQRAPPIAGGSPEKALEAARELARRVPVRGNLALAPLLLAKADWKGAEAAYAAALSALDASSLEALAGLANMQSVQGDVAASVATAQRILAIDPAHADALFIIGRAGATTGEQLDLAASSLRQLLALPDDARHLPVSLVHWRLGQVLERQHDLSGARTQYEAAIAADPTLADAKTALDALP
jgi:tetratricopeptide (TPR) repeat protein